MPRSSLSRVLVLALLVAALVFAATHAGRAAGKAPIPPPKDDAALAQAPGKETAIFAGGCFWGTQSVFEHVKGVLATTAGYGRAPPPRPTIGERRRTPDTRWSMSEAAATPDNLLSAVREKLLIARDSMARTERSA